MRLDADDRRVLIQGAIILSLVFIVLVFAAVAVGVAVRIFTLLAGF